MDPQAITQFFAFTRELEKLKKLERFRGQHYWVDYPEISRFESVADHTWRLGMLVVMFSERLAKKIDLEKALKMVLVHDLPEIVVGDASPLGDDGMGANSHAFDPAKAAEKHEDEKNAITTLCNMLPPEEAKKFFDIWVEYDLQESFESKVIKSLDKIEAMMQVLEYREGHFFEKHLEFNIRYGLKGSDIDPAIFAFGNHIAEEMKKLYKEFKKEDTL